MPRTGRGGMRQGNPGTAYPNRTDLAAQPSLPARVATDQTYGKAQQQLQAQRTVPMRPAPVPMPTAQPAAVPQAPAPLPPIAPGAFGDLHRPTDRPTEPVTSGIPSGPGPGPEALPTAQQMTGGNNLSTMLAGIAQRTNSPAISALAEHAAAAGT